MLASGLNHVATLTNDARRPHALCEEVFEAEVIPARSGRRMIETPAATGMGTAARGGYRPARHRRSPPTMQG
jgi:hypothetical protein